MGIATVTFSSYGGKVPVGITDVERGLTGAERLGESSDIAGEGALL